MCISLISVVAQFGSIYLEANLGNRLYIYRHSIIDMCVKICVSARGRCTLYFAYMPFSTHSLLHRMRNRDKEIERGRDDQTTLFTKRAYYANFAAYALNLSRQWVNERKAEETLSGYSQIGITLIKCTRGKEKSRECAYVCVCVFDTFTSFQ